MSTEVVVVGAGLAGLAAAGELARAGCSVTLLERGARAGGRHAGESRDGFSLERSPAALSTADARLLGWVRELGLATALLPARPLQLTQLCGGRIEPISERTPLRIGRIPGVRWRHALRLQRLPRLMRRYRPLLDPEAPEGGADLDFRSVADFGRLYFGSSVVDHWMGPAVTVDAGGDAADLSRLLFLLSWMAGDEGRAGSCLLQGGLHQLAASAAEQLDVRFRARAERLEAKGAGPAITLHANGAAAEGPSEGAFVLEADAVVLATAPPETLQLAAPMLTLAERDVLSELDAAPAMTLSVALDRAPAGIPQLVRVPRPEASPIVSMLLDPGGPGLRAPMGSGLATLALSERFSLSQADASDARVERKLLAEFERIQPAAAAHVAFTRLERVPSAVPRFGVGAYRALARFGRVQQHQRAQGRRLYFAGDYLVGPRPENAVASGLRAARWLLADC